MVNKTCVPVENNTSVVPYEHRTSVIQARVTTKLVKEDRISYVLPRRGNCK